MSTGGWLLAGVVVVTVAVLLFLLAAEVRSVRDERTPGRRLWREFALSFVLLLLFVSSWIGQGIAEWQVFTDDQRTHGEEPAVGDFMSEFAQSTLENWQSEFLQLFTMVVLTTFLIHRHSHESRDSQDRMQEQIEEILTLVKERSK
jgi:membrane protein implicated in regulation of membrane protease activity